MLLYFSRAVLIQKYAPGSYILLQMRLNSGQVFNFIILANIDFNSCKLIYQQLEANRYLLDVFLSKRQM